VIVTDACGAQLQAPLDVSTDVAWIGFANAQIREQVWSVLPEVLRAHGLSPHDGGPHDGAPHDGAPHAAG
jgi:hypothetical protein